MTALDRLFALEHHGIKLGLDNIQALTDALGRPQDAWPAIHIAGTNGKGSVTAMVERALRAAGHRTGRYTSPHLASIEERVAIDGAPVDSAAFAAVAGEVLDLAERLQRDGRLAAVPTFFEVTTALAFEIFRRANVSVAVVEVGLGGRFDATNVLAPRLTAITSIALDHQRYLGSTLGDIAFEKAGIIKPGIPVVTGDLAPAAFDVIAGVADARGAPLIAAGRGCRVASALDRGRAIVTIDTPLRQYTPIRLGLAGAHQVDNALVAVRLLESCEAAGLALSSDHITEGLEQVDWPARLEWLTLDEGRHVLIDAAHNPAGASALADYLDAAGVAPLPIVLAVMQDKDVAGIVRALLPAASAFIATTAGTARSLHPQALAGEMSRVAPGLPVSVAADPHGALETALARGRVVVAAGSIFLVGPLRAHLVAGGARPGGDPP